MQKRLKVQVVVISIKEKTSLLMQVNKRRGSFWQNITGGVDNSEPLLSACLRELYEETGIQKDRIKSHHKLELTYSFVDQYGHDVTEHCYLVTIDEQMKISIDKDEHQHYKWICISEINKSHYFFDSNYHAFLESVKFLSI